MRNDPDFLEFLWLWNQRNAQVTPAIHQRIARWLMARPAAGDRRLLLMAFRGCGKSTLIGLWCAWLLLRNPSTRILVVAADAPLAVRMVATVRRILETHPLCAELLPDVPENWARIASPSPAPVRCETLPCSRRAFPAISRARVPM